MRNVIACNKSLLSKCLNTDDSIFNPYFDFGNIIPCGNTRSDRIKAWGVAENASCTEINENCTEATFETKGYAPIDVIEGLCHLYPEEDFEWKIEGKNTDKYFTYNSKSGVLAYMECEHTEEFDIMLLPA